MRFFFSTVLLFLFVSTAMASEKVTMGSTQIQFNLMAKYKTPNPNISIYGIGGIVSAPEKKVVFTLAWGGAAFKLPSLGIPAADSNRVFLLEGMSNNFVNKGGDALQSSIWWQIYFKHGWQLFLELDRHDNFGHWHSWYYYWETRKHIWGPIHGGLVQKGTDNKPDFGFHLDLISKNFQMFWRNFYNPRDKVFYVRWVFQLTFSS